MKDPIVDSEILHGGEGRDVERWLESRNKFFVLAIACLLISSLYIAYFVLLLHFHIQFIALNSSFLFVDLYSS